jgi:predicted phosphoribosyltransferase
MTPAPFDSIGRWYEFFAPTSDGEVRELLAMAREERSRGANAPGHSSAISPLASW